ncbi:peptidylprolyl isomerase [Cohnella pontilimi]|uniref:Peptidyl-prolyl cis-trans isomerase n=2 Tax=Cohnella pontilimi TaxID=2564100 RepID=A0A4U0FBF6_9BACL|nr:peptidylprolyl isomerase [Cohnella pontilimi]
MKSKLKVSMLLVFIAALVVAGGCGKRDDGGQAASPSDTPAVSPSVSPSASASASIPTTGSSDKNPLVTIEMDNGHTIQIELYPEVAPNTVNNFISLVKKGFYDGIIFHRVIPGFMIQGGDPQGTGMGGPGYAIKGEFTNNGFQNDLKHTRGVISMARSRSPDSAGSQFFIMHADYPSLDSEYAAFGKVTEGMDTVDEIVNQKIDPNDPEQSRPEKPMVMKKVTVDTKGVEYKEPEIIK